MAWTTPATYSSGQVLTAANLNTHIRDNFNELSPAKCTAIGDVFYATGNKALSRLAIGNPYQVLYMNAGQTAPVWGESYSPLDVITQDAEVLSNAAETTIYTSPDIGNNLLGTTSAITFEAWVSYLNNTGSSQTVAIRIKLDGVSIFTPINASQATSATRRGTIVRYTLLQNQSASAQKHFIGWQASSAAGAMTTIDAIQSSLFNYATSAVDMSSGSHAVTVTIDHGAASSTLSCIFRLSGLWLTRSV